MGLESTHPLYDAFAPDWVMQRDLVAGESVVKSKRETYLPPTPSMILDGFGKGLQQVGEQVYEGYLKRAQFPDYVSDGVEVLTGMLHHKPATIEVPKQMEPMLESCTLSGESMQDLLRRINTEQLTTGRIGLLADLPTTPNASTVGQPTKSPTEILPYIVTYAAESIKNWDEADTSKGFSALNLVILDESCYVRDAEFTWKLQKRFRVLQFGDLNKSEAEGTAVYKTATFTEANGLTYNEADLQPPQWLGKSLDEIPFVFINTKDLVSSPDKPPLLGLGKLVLAIYRGEADYRQGLFMTGQDTLVIIGGTSKPDAAAGDDGAVRTGAGSRIDVDVEGDAKYIGVDSNGLSEQRECLENDHKRAATKSGQLLPSGKANSQESGEALKTRVAAQTASLTQIALTGAKGLETLLKSIAVWIGADPEKVKVTPNMEFGELAIAPADIKGLMEARLTGAPLSKKSIHGLLVEKRLTTMTFDEEMAQIMEEDADMPRTAAGAGTLTAEEQLAQQDEERRLAEEKANDTKNKPVK